MTNSLLAQDMQAVGTTSGVSVDQPGRGQRLRAIVIPWAVSGVLLTAPLGTATSGAPVAAASEVVSAVRAANRDIARTTTGRLLLDSSDSSGQLISDSGDIAASVRALKARSGLTWGELASAIGVSTRSVHLWVNGAPISAANAKRLTSLSELVSTNERQTARLTRERLIAPGTGGGSSLLSRFRIDGAADTTRKLSYFPMREFLASDAPGADPSINRPTRTTSVKVRRLRKRGAAGE